MNKRSAFVIILSIMVMFLLLFIIANQEYNIVTFSQNKSVVVDEAREICSYENFVFYIKGKNKFAELVRYDTTTNAEEKIYKYDYLDDKTDAIELYAVKNNVIWVEESDDLSWKIIQYNLRDNKKNVIRTSEQSQSAVPACLAANDNYIAWYESNYSDKNKTYDVLNIYDIQNGSIEQKETNMFGNPYLRPYIRNDWISYIIKKDKSYCIEIYNLVTNEKKYINCFSNVSKLMSNGRYTVWLDDYENRNIYIYDHEKNQSTKIDGSLNVFTFMLIDKLYISYTADDDGYSNIYSMELSTGKMKNVTKNKNENTAYYICKLNVDNRLLYEKDTKDTIEIVLE